MPSHKHDHVGCLLMIFVDGHGLPELLGGQLRFGLGNSPNKETRKGNKAVFDNTVHHHIHSENTGDFCNLIGCHRQ